MDSVLQPDSLVISVAVLAQSGRSFSVPELTPDFS